MIDLSDDGAPWNGSRSIGPVDADVEAFARQLCAQMAGKPDKLIGEPPAPRWHSWIRYGENALHAAKALGWSRQILTRVEANG